MQYCNLYPCSIALENSPDKFIVKCFVLIIIKATFQGINCDSHTVIYGSIHTIVYRVA